MDEFGPLNLQPHPGKHWAPAAAGHGDQASPRRRRRRATYKRPAGVRHLMAGYDLSTDRLYGHIVTRKGRTEFLAFARYLRSLHPAHVRIAIVMDNYSPHLSTKVDTRVGDWAQANNVEIAYVSFYGSWLNRIEPQFTALRYFALDGTDHSSHHEQASMIRRYIAWRNSHLTDPSYAKSSAEPAPSNGQRLPDAVLARPQRRPVLHLPAHWPWPTKWLAIWNGVFATRTGARTPDGRLRPSTAEQARPEEPQ
jgi:hypothetical protein